MSVFVFYNYYQDHKNFLLLSLQTINKTKAREKESFQKIIIDLFSSP